MKKTLKTKKQRTLSLVAIALCASLGTGLVPALPVSAKEPEMRSMNLGTDGIQGGVDKIYLGSYTYDGKKDSDALEDKKTVPVAYRVLATQGGNGGTYKNDKDKPVKSEDAMFLLSEYIMGYHRFDDDSNNSNDYGNSELKQWCGIFALGKELTVKLKYVNGESFDYVDKKVTSVLDAREQAAILKTTKQDGALNWDDDRLYLGESELQGEKVFLLSGQEVTETAYGFDAEIGNPPDEFTPSDTRVAKDFVNNETPYWWWLRSPCADSKISAGNVDLEGCMDYINVGYLYPGVRPALNLNRTSVLFTSAAEGGKEGIVGQLEEVPTLPSTGAKEWKLTLKDNDRKFDIDDEQQREAQTVRTNDASSYHLEFDYTGATPDADLTDESDEVISAMIMEDGSDNILYYGAIAQPTEADGKIEVNLPTDLAAGDYTLKLFSEQLNGDQKTDYASDFEDIPFTLEMETPQPTPAPKPDRPSTHKPDKETPVTPTPDTLPGSPDRPGSVDTKKAGVPAGGTYEALVYGVTDPNQIKVEVSDPEVAGFTISSDPRGSKIRVFGKKEGKVIIKITANGIVTEMEVEVKPLGGSMLVDTKSVTIPAGQQYQIGLTLFDENDQPLTPEQIKALLSPAPYEEPINPNLLTIRDSRTGSVVDMQVLDNGHLLLTAKNPPANSVAYLQIFYKGQSYSVKVTAAPANAARAGESNSQRLYWAKTL